MADLRGRAVWSEPIGQRFETSCCSFYIPLADFFLTLLFNAAATAPAAGYDEQHDDDGDGYVGYEDHPMVMVMPVVMGILLSGMSVTRGGLGNSPWPVMHSRDPLEAFARTEQHQIEQGVN